MYKDKGRYVRFRSVDNLFDEIKQVINQYKDYIKNIEFYDDTFTLDEKRVQEKKLFCRIICNDIFLYNYSFGDKFCSCAYD